MDRRIGSAAVCVLLAGALCGAQSPADTVIEKIFAARVDTYVQMHRRLEGPIPPLEASKDMAEVQRLMKDLRGRIVAERRGTARGYFFTKAVTDMFRRRISAALTRSDISDIDADLKEHTPAWMPAPRVNEPLPDNAPFVEFPPKLLEQLPPLPPELRYVMLARALVIWDHHAGLVVDIAPKLFDPRTYSTD